jgi:hypothetical protein
MLVSTHNPARASVKRKSPSSTTASTAPQEKKRQVEPERNKLTTASTTTTTTVSTQDASSLDDAAAVRMMDVLLAGAVALDESRVWRPIAHLAPSDVHVVSGERPPGRKQGYALHAIILRMRSPVFASMLASEHTTTNEPIELPESGDELGLFFECLYSNSPQQKLSAGLDVCTIARLSHKYCCLELETLCSRQLQKMAVKVRLDTSPNLADLLLCAQNTKNEALTATIVGRPMEKLFSATPSKATPNRCAVHPAQRVPCCYQTASCTQLPPPAPPFQLDQKHKDVLSKLNSKTLVSLIEKISGALAETVAATTAARRLY